LLDGNEIAVLDVRELGVHTEQGHILLSTPLPLSHLEMRAAILVPRKSVRCVVYDTGNEGLAERAARRLTELGYTDVCILDGGLAAWQKSGGEVFTGSNVLTKAFGEFVEQEYGTPHMSAVEVKRRKDAGEKLVLLDSRPMPEFKAFSVPGALDAPGAELVYRFYETVKDPDATVVVNCAGRTRSIIGAQAVINAGVPNKVVALENGTMAWLMAGYELDSGKMVEAPKPNAASLEAAKASRDRLVKRFGVRTIDAGMLERFRAEKDKRSLFVLDVRTREEYEAGHLPGARWAPGGQLVQAFDEWVGVFNARIVLTDGPDAVRATLTASWLIQLNVAEVYVLTHAPDAFGLERGGEPELLAAALPAVARIEPAALKAELEAGKATVIDVDQSARYREGHVAGAIFTLRSRLAGDVGKIPGEGAVVVTSRDGVLASFAADEIAKLTTRPVKALAGGTAGWAAAGLPLEKGDGATLHPMEDCWVSPYSFKTKSERFAAFQRYLDWEIGLVAQLARDGTTRFRTFPAAR
jgi:rhodanese-related sulfurtransferase